MNSNKHSSLDDFWARQARRKQGTEGANAGADSDDRENDLAVKGPLGGRKKLFAVGAKFGDLEVLGPGGGQILGALGYMRSDRSLRVKCHACERQFVVSYERLYNGGQIPENCGCKTVYKHPPYRIEDQVVGCVLIVQWDRNLGEWEMVCQECGSILYRRTRAEVVEAGDSCSGHGTQHSAPLRRGISSSNTI